VEGNKAPIRCGLSMTLCMPDRVRVRVRVRVRLWGKVTVRVKTKE
jgi:hypothetical protein